ncbi:MAG: SAM-dependent methyltransferase [Epulopiscium sp.]|nr:SAM-dependent methyltransferase [Candidatus Epulonipiscium sp.]
MKLSKRLYAIASKVPKGSVIADIGTDHGYIPIYLFKEGIIEKAIATDINQGPLNKAAKNIKQHKCEKAIEIRLGNGLEKVNPKEADTLIIAGMGGMLIIDILNQNPRVVETTKRIILQPQLDQKELRKYLHRIHFKIIHEDIIWEENKYYWVIISEPGNEQYDDEMYYTFGKVPIENKNPILTKYIKEQLLKSQKVLEQLNKTKTDNTYKRIQEVNKEIKDYKKVLKCL